MNETLRLLYDKFYTLPMVESEQEVETCHRQLGGWTSQSGSWCCRSSTPRT
ncbi:MAG: hypothetical protein ACLSWS_21520 [Faecalispora jeddahensis]